MCIWQFLQEIYYEIKLSAVKTSDREKNRQRRFVIEIDIYVYSVWHNSSKSSINRKDLRYTFSIWHVRVTYKDETIEQKIYWRKSVSKLRICSCLRASCHLNFSDLYEFGFFQKYGCSNRISEMKRKENRSRSQEIMLVRWTKEDGHVNEGKGRWVTINLGKFRSLKCFWISLEEIIELRLPLVCLQESVDTERNQRRHVCQHFVVERLQWIHQGPVHRD